MSTKKPRLWNPRPHRAVDWNEKAISKRLEKGPLYACTKYDGFRCLITKINGEVRITTREGIELTSLTAFRPKFAALLDGYHDRILDAEVLVLGHCFEDMSGLLRRDDPLPVKELPNVMFVVFDLVRTEVMLHGGDSPTRSHRIETLYLELPGAPVHPRGGIYHEEYTRVHTLEDVRREYLFNRAHGYEGLILKDPYLPYRNGKVTGWWKVKPGCGADFAPGFEADGVTVGYVWGDEEKSNAGKIVGYRVKLEDGTEVNATGLTQEQMQVATAKHGQGHSRLGLHCRVSGMERTKDGSIRHPHFDGFRDVGGTKA